MLCISVGHCAFQIVLVHRNHFTLRINHKPLELLAMVSMPMDGRVDGSIHFKISA
jgi:hypothetical protein